MSGTTARVVNFSRFAGQLTVQGVKVSLTIPDGQHYDIWQALMDIRMGGNYSEAQRAIAIAILHFYKATPGKLDLRDIIGSVKLARELPSSHIISGLSMLLDVMGTVEPVKFEVEQALRRSMI